LHYGYPEGDRPGPTRCFPADTVAKHLVGFEGGAYYLTSDAGLDRRVRDKLGRSDGQFVLPPKVLDDIFLRTKGDMALIEKELGIPAGSWQDQEFVRIDISDPKSLNVRLPSGNEDGANDLWIPGGKLPAGQSEAVKNQIPKGSYTETRLSESVKRVQQ
jgi:hypothetical protein